MSNPPPKQFIALGPQGVQVRRRSPLVEDFDLGGEIHVLPKLPLDVALLENDIPHPNLWLMTPAAENAFDHLELGLKAILLVVPFACPRSLLLTWREPTLQREKIEHGYFDTTGFGMRVGLHELGQARSVLRGLQLVFDDRNFMRLRRGLHTFYQGLRQDLTEERLGHFVRSLEAVVSTDSRKNHATICPESSGICRIFARD